MPRRVPDDVEKYRWWEAHRWLAVFALVVLVAAITGATYHFWPRTVYVTDGGHVWNGNLSAVEAKIKKENDWVTSTGKPFVSIAVVATMSPQPNVEPLDANRTRHAIEGAYLAQYESNHPEGPNGRIGSPLIKLLLADEGNQESSWQQVATQLEAKVGSADHLVAVTGLGISVTNTVKLVSELGASPHTIAMVGSVLTGDEFVGLTGLVLIAPTNSDQASAAAKFLNTNPDPDNPLPQHTKVWIVQDQNGSDNYAGSLATTFPSALASVARHSKRQYEIVPPGMVYNSSLPAAAGVLADPSTGDDVCHAGANVVYFAGRGVDLRGLLTGLAHRYCASSQPLTVLTGSDASHLLGQSGLWSDGANMHVYYTALANPAIWRQPSVVDQATVAWFDQYPYGFRTMFPGETLDDSWAIMFHDGVLTAVTAIDKLYDAAGSIPSAGAVAQELNQVTVHGASGYICFNAGHDPIDKAVPIVQLNQNGQLGDVTLSSASGRSPNADPCD